MLHWRAFKGATLLDYCCLICCPNVAAIMRTRNFCWSILKNVTYPRRRQPTHQLIRTRAHKQSVWNRPETLSADDGATMIVENRRRSKFNWRRIKQTRGSARGFSGKHLLGRERLFTLPLPSPPAGCHLYRRCFIKMRDKCQHLNFWQGAACLWLKSCSLHLITETSAPPTPTETMETYARFHSVTRKERTWQLDSRLIPVIMQKWGRKEPEIRIFFPKL